MIRQLCVTLFIFILTFGAMYAYLERQSASRYLDAVPGLRMVLDVFEAGITFSAPEAPVPAPNLEDQFGLFTETFEFEPPLPAQPSRSGSAPAARSTPPLAYVPSAPPIVSPVTTPVTPTVQEPANRAPEFNKVQDKIVTKGDMVTFAIRAEDRDGDALFYRAVSLPAGSSFDPSTRRFVWQPLVAGTHVARFEVSDGTKVAREAVSIIVEDADQPGVVPVTPETPATSTDAANIIDVRTMGAKLDGATDDSVVIQAALDAATAGKIVLIDGIAAVGAKGLSLHDKTGVTLRGKKTGDGIKPLAPPTENRPVAVLYKGVLQVQKCNSCIVENITMHGNNIDGVMIAVSESRDTIIRNNVINNTGIALAAFSGAGNTNNKYLNNTIFRTGSNAQQATRGMWIGNIWPAEFERNTVISGNKISQTAAASIGLTVENGTITNNEINHLNGSQRGGGIAIAGSAPPNNSSSNLLIENNIVAGAARDGIQGDSYVRAGQRSEGAIDGPDAWLLPNITIRNNQLYNNGGTGIYAVWGENWTITGNTIRDNGTTQNFRPHGIYVSASRSINISNNSLYNSGAEKTQQYGVYVSSGGASYVEDVTVSNNQIYNHSKSGLIANNCCGGITKRLAITSNTIRDNAEYGMIIYPEKPSDFQNFTVSNNTLSNNALGSVRTNMPEFQAAAAFGALGLQDPTFGRVLLLGLCVVAVVLLVIVTSGAVYRHIVR